MDNHLTDEEASPERWNDPSDTGRLGKGVRSTPGSSHPWAGQGSIPGTGSSIFPLPIRKQDACLRDAGLHTGPCT